MTTRRLPDATNRHYDSDLEFDLLVSQRNELFRLVAEAGFAQNEFQWLASDGAFIGIEGLVIPMIEHEPTKSWCRFGLRDEDDHRHSPLRNEQPFYGEFFLQRSPGETKADDMMAWASWKQIVGGFAEWLGFVRRESTEPDYWEVAPPAGIFPATGPPASNETFSVEERLRITDSLSEIENEVHRVAELSEAQITAFRETIAYLEESATRLGRKDWLNNMIGAFFSWALSTSLNSPAAQTVLDFMGSRLSWLWSELPKLIR
jgi:hypothetical protein